MSAAAAQAEIDRRATSVQLLALALLVAMGCDREPAPIQRMAGPTHRVGLLIARSVTTPESELPITARLDRLRLVSGVWTSETLEDRESRVFHFARVYDPPGATPRSILTLGGTVASAKLWRPGADGRLRSSEIWRASYGARNSRMRDAEIGPLYGDEPAPGGLVGDVVAVGTHDEGVVAVLSPRGDGSFEVTELDRRPNTLVHEIEIGDLDDDGLLEVYAAISDYTSLMPGVNQPGSIVRYVPASGRGPETVVDLGRRHAKEMLVDDVDGDGRDELYVVVEARTEGLADAMEIAEPVEVRRFEAGDEDGVVIATFEDRMTRFLVAGDLEGDGRRELVAATFSVGLYRLVPSADPRARWDVELLDADSRGFEHATLLADLDEDGADELYVADDASGELRRYRSEGSGLRREVIARTRPRGAITWSLSPSPAELMP